MSTWACGLVSTLWVQLDGSPLRSGVGVLGKRDCGGWHCIPNDDGGGYSETTGWQSDLGRERRDQSELLILVEILSAVAWICSVLRWVR